MGRINRRALLVTSTSVLLGSPADSEAVASGPGPHQQPSRDLSDLIHEHRSAYALFCEAMHASGRDAAETAKIGRDEEAALLAICSFRALTDCDRRTKAEYLLEIERRGELDLSEHIRAVLQSML